ncbi:MAG TPA: DUF354 domain-containing protein [Nitrososphaerales archaeon]|nr:DUF354 domain-containing protein [Nitrososphaerales archaeon]
MKKTVYAVKLWIDALTPKQAIFSKAMIDRAPSKFKITVTTRQYTELVEFAKLIGLDSETIGRHGGGDVVGKLRASVERERELVEFVTKRDFDASFSFISPEAARVSFGSGLTHYICSDSPHASAPCRLAVPLCSKLFSPFPIRKERWTKYGIRGFQVLRYHALDPWTWLVSKRKPDRSNAKQRVIIRLEESFASYMRAQRGITGSLSDLLDLIRKYGDYEILLLPRYDTQREWARKKFRNLAIIPGSAVDGLKLLSEASLVIGGGGTMTQEAALLGIPNISYFPSAKLDVFENFYFPKGLSLRANTPSELLRETKNLLSNLDLERKRFAHRAVRATSSFEDPVKFVFRNLE